MAKIKIMLENKEGKQIGEMQEYELEVGQGSLLEIEAAVEKFKRSSLPKIEQELMIEAQEQEVKKKRIKTKWNK